MRPTVTTAAAPTMIPLDRPWVIGHRGFPGRATENTLPSFAAALAAGARGIECDVRATRDGRAVVFHDDTTERLLGLSGRLEDRTCDEVGALRFAGDGELRIPALEDVLTLGSERDAVVLVELKGSPLVSTDFVRAVVAAVERTRTRERVGFLSFSHAAVAALHELAPGIPCAPLFESRPPLEAVLQLGAGWVVLAADAADAALCGALRACGVEVGCYGVDDAESDARLDGLGVGLRITDRPDLLAARRSQH